MNNDSDEEFEATYEVGDGDEDDNGRGEAVAETLVVPPAVSQPMDVSPFMCSLDLDAMHVPEFPEYVNIGTMVEEYNVNYKRLQERGEAYACWCNNIELPQWVYISDVYKMSEICKIYRIEFVPLDDTVTWPDYPGPTMVANSALRRTSKCRYKSTHYLNEMDSQKMRSPRVCRLCERQGHNRSRCPQRAGPSGVGGSGDP
ncbi:hypothetical protein AHAS_Ahas14G0103500 [Arachis hypogaea]